MQAETQSKLERATHYLTSVVRFYAISYPVEIEVLDRADAIVRLQALDQLQALSFSRNDSNTPMALHLRWLGGARMLIGFQGRFEDRDGRVFLNGSVGVDPGARIIAAVLCVAVLLFLPLLGLFGSESSGALGNLFVVQAGLVALLIFAFAKSKNEPAKIIAEIRGALNAPAA